MTSFEDQRGNMSSLDQKILQLVDMLSFLSRDEDRLHVFGKVGRFKLAIGEQVGFVENEDQLFTFRAR